MDIQMNTAGFKQFLTRCAFGGLMRDLVIHTAPNHKIMARVADKMCSLYAEIYQDGVKVTEEGNIRIPNLQKLIAVINRTDSDMVRIKSTADAFLVSDGTGVGKLHANMAQQSDAEIVESYQAIQDRLDVFDRDTLLYSKKIQFADGVEIDVPALQTLLDDSKAFGYETFKIMQAKGMLKCKIENNQNGENFTRTIADKNFIGSVENIPTSVVGIGFKELVKAIKDSNGKEKIKCYFHDLAWLITNGNEFFYLINTVEVE